jgi:hypothetical protein
LSEDGVESSDDELAKLRRLRDAGVGAGRTSSIHSLTMRPGILVEVPAAAVGWLVRRHAGGRRQSMTRTGVR